MGTKLQNFFINIKAKGKSATSIYKILNVNDRTVSTKPEVIGGHFKHFFQSLFTYSKSTGIDESLCHMEKKVTD